MYQPSSSDLHEVVSNMMYDIELNFDKTQKQMLKANVEWYLSLASGTYRSDGLTHGVVRNYFRALTLAELLVDEAIITKVRNNILTKVIKETINHDNQ